MFVTYADSRLVICNILICDRVKNIFLVQVAKPGFVLQPLLMFLQFIVEWFGNIVIWRILVNFLNFEEISMDLWMVPHQNTITCNYVFNVQSFFLIWLAPFGGQLHGQYCPSGVSHHYGGLTIRNRDRLQEFTVKYISVYDNFNL